MKLDKNLIFLKQAANEELLVLCDIVTKEKDGTFRTTETLTETQPYRRCYPNNIKGMLPELIHEFRLFGGNSILNFFRGEGPDYPEILRDVAYRYNVSFNNATAQDEYIEILLLSKFINIALDAASNDELRQMMYEMKVHASRFNRQNTILELQKLWTSGSVVGFKLMSTVTSSVLTQLTGLTIGAVAGVTLSRLSMIMLGPVGFILSSLYCAMDIAGPAYRVTIPAVIQIAYLRQRIKFSSKKGK